jgi:hypothetical protein
MGQFTHDGVIYEELPSGQVRVVGFASQPAGGGNGYVVPPNPILARRQSEKDARDADASRRDNIRTQIAINNQDKPADGYRWVDAQHSKQEIIPGGPADPNKVAGLTPAQRLDLKKGYDSLSNLTAGIQKLKDQYQASFKGKDAKEYLPSTLRPSNGVFNDTSGALSAYVATALGLSGQQFNTPAEQQLFIGSILPRAGDTDAQIENKLQWLDDLATRARSSAESQLGIATPPAVGGGGLPGNGAAANQPGLTPSGGGERTFYTERDQALSREVKDAFAKGASREQIDAIAVKYGMGRYGEDLDRAIEHRNRTGSSLLSVVPQATGHEETGVSGKIADAVGSNYGSFAAGVGNAVTIGQLGNIAKMTGGSSAGTDLAMDLTQRNVVPYMLGEVAGSVLPTVGATRGLRSGAELVENPFIRSAMAHPAAGGVMYGAGYGASTSDDPLKGGLIGAGLGLAGHYAGAKIGSAAAAVRKPTVAEALTGGEAATLNAVNKTGRDAVIDALTQAADLNVPANLADVSPDVNSLTGAAIRRSPAAAGLARDTLLPRGRGQYDRMVSAVGRDLGPVENIPQRSEELIQTARTQAGPLYDTAYAAPGAGAIHPQIEPLLSRPSIRSALARARTIAAEEGRDPAALGFDLDAEGNTILTRVPSWQTLDYAKRGIDDVLEGFRDKTTGRLHLDEHGKAIDNTRRELLSLVDEANPDYAAARAAYAGPASEREALRMGQDAASLSPDQLVVNANRATPTQLEQMRLGFQSQLAENAGKLRYSTNPFESVLGTPAMEQRLSTLYGDTSEVARLLSQRDLETRLAASSNRLIGNSMTAERQIADEAFGPNPIIEGALHAGAAVATHGGSIPGTAARLVGTGIKDRVALGLGQRAVQKADEIAPITLDTDPRQTIARLLALEQKQQDYDVARALIQGSGAKWGGRVGSPVAAALIPYAAAD